MISGNSARPFFGYAFVALGSMICAVHVRAQLPFTMAMAVGALSPIGLSQDTDANKQEHELVEAVRRTPNDPALLLRLGSLLATENKLEESVSIFEKALKLRPGDIETRRSMATIYWQLGQLDTSRRNLEIALKGKPDDPLAMLLLGMVSEDLGDHQRAAKLLGDVLPLVRQRPETIDSLARAYYHLGEREKAQKSLEMLAGHASGPEAA